MVNPYDDLGEMLLISQASIRILGLYKLEYNVIHGGSNALLVNVAHELLELGPAPTEQPTDHASVHEDYEQRDWRCVFSHTSNQ
jgi:hypothetical protein